MGCNSGMCARCGVRHGPTDKRKKRKGLDKRQPAWYHWNKSWERFYKATEVSPDEQVPEAKET